MFVLNNGERKRERERLFICGFCCVMYGVVWCWHDNHIFFSFFFSFSVLWIFLFLIFFFCSIWSLDPLDVHVAQTFPYFYGVCFVRFQFLKWLGHNAPCLKVGWWCNVLCMRVMNCVAVTISRGNWQIGSGNFFTLTVGFVGGKYTFVSFV